MGALTWVARGEAGDCDVFLQSLVYITVMLSLLLLVTGSLSEPGHRWPPRPYTASSVVHSVFGAYCAECRCSLDSDSPLNNSSKHLRLPFFQRTLDMESSPTGLVVLNL